jgi:hypothetical protein
MFQILFKKRIILFLLILLLVAGQFHRLYAQSQAVLVKSINISNAGSGPRMRMGDLNGDGRLDFLMVQATSKTPSQVQMLTAYDGYNGNLLWQVGSDNGLTGTDRDEPAQIHDIDNDGVNEVVAVMNDRLRILNGTDGSLEREFSLPNSNAHDCIIFANFSGNSIAQDIVLKDRYTNAWALDKNGQLLWTYSGITGHYPWPYDIDNDGRDEFFIGYSCLDYEGRSKYQPPINYDHPDCCWLGDMDNNASNGIEIVYGLAQNPSCQAVRTSTGQVIWTNSGNTESQQVLLADFRDDLSGLEVYGLDRVNRSTQDALFIISSSGQTLWKETPDDSGYTTAIKLVRNWDGTNKPMCLAIKRGGGILPELRDGRGNIVARMPMDGTACVGDFGGDSKQEILMYSTSTANIYAVSQFDYDQPAPRPGNPLVQPKEYYNYSRYGSGDVNALKTAPAATAGPTPVSTVSLGDVNGDDTINIVDALLVAQYYVGLNPANFDSGRADTNCNGTIDIVDALLIAQYYVGLVDHFC